MHVYLDRDTAYEAKWSKSLKNIDLTKVKEDGDYTDLKGEIACAGGGGFCEI